MSVTTYEKCAQFFDGLAASGVEHVVVSPGSRSTPLALTARASALRVWIQLDERSAGFFALGLAKASGRAVVLVCTSGTAAANYLPAVVEANHAGVALIVVTADRPPELRRWGAGQTIDQVGIYGTNVRWFAELPVGGETTENGATWAGRALAESTGPRPGPVHLNWPFREPLEPPSGGLPQPRDKPVRISRTRAVPDPTTTEDLIALAERYERGVICAGPGDLGAAAEHAIVGLSAAVGWPIIAEPVSGLRTRRAATGTTVVATADSALRHERLGHALRPDVVVRVGLAPTTKPVRRWIDRCEPEHLVIVGPGVEWSDPSHRVTSIVAADIEATFSAWTAATTGDRGTEWSTRWSQVDDLAGGALTRALGIFDDPRAHAPGVVRTLADHLDADDQLYVSNSMPERDLDTYRPLHDARILSNRGASGIDGLCSSALGASATGRPTTLLTGDLAFLHDLGGLTAAARLGLSLTVVVVDNDGGGIFSFLPIASHPATNPDAFAELFHTPHGLDLTAVSRGFGATVHCAELLTDLEPALLAARAERAGGRPGVSVVHVVIDHAHDLAIHRSVQAHVASTLDELPVP